MDNIFWNCTFPAEAYQLMICYQWHHRLSSSSYVYTVTCALSQFNAASVLGSKVKVRSFHLHSYHFCYSCQCKLWKCITEWKKFMNSDVWIYLWVSFQCTNAHFEWNRLHVCISDGRFASEENNSIWFTVQFDSIRFSTANQLTFLAWVMFVCPFVTLVIHA